MTSCLIVACYSDISIPQLQATMTDKQPQIDALTQMIRQQATLESRVAQRERERRDTTPYPDPSTDCKPPS